MDFTLNYHFKPKKGWMNDPNGLIWYKGYYHVFYQASPNSERQTSPVVWGHAITKDFINWEHLPIALNADTPYDKDGCWSGTAIEKDGVMYLFYASIMDGQQQVSVAYSKDGYNFEKYSGNPIIKKSPIDGLVDFRDPAIIKRDDGYYMVVASGNPNTDTAILFCFKSEDMFNWEYCGTAREIPDREVFECPSFGKIGNKVILASSVVYKNWASSVFSVEVGSFKEGNFIPEIIGYPQYGPDQYAGQIFIDEKGRNILLTWVPGWGFKEFAEKSLGCLSLPMEVFVKDGKIYTYPVEEVRHLLKDGDEIIKRTSDGFIIERQQREPVVYKGEIKEMKVLRDGYIIEIFINGGETVVTAVIC